MVKLLLPRTLLHVLSLQFLLLLLLLLLLCVSWGSSVVVSSGSEIVADHPPPHELRSFTIRENLQKEDAISLAFGDLYRNEVYVPRLDDPSSGTFERCSTDTFKIKGPCGYGVCYLYLRRNGWMVGFRNGFRSTTHTTAALSPSTTALLSPMAFGTVSTSAPEPLRPAPPLLILSPGCRVISIISV
uniref:Uncharacterized protein n=1 Tax=Ananas comosus var. bracteatus TaxID=296719 RepID=A0A6V7QJ20_ANACO|nr:unnamed protein product [Ananas comosus var. bracteatus]